MTKKILINLWYVPAFNIKIYIVQIVQKSEEPEPEEMMDLFVDMAPKIRKQKKIYVGKGIR